MPMFRNKSIIIEAKQYERNELEIAAWMGENAHGARTHPDGFAIPTCEGKTTASPGDWIIKCDDGKFYLCEPDIFAATYEPC